MKTKTGFTVVISFILISSCKKEKSVNPLSDWEGNWTVTDYNEYFDQYPQGGSGPIHEISRYYKRNNDFYYYHQIPKSFDSAIYVNLKGTLHSDITTKLKDDTLIISELYQGIDSSGIVRIKRQFENKIALVSGIYKYDYYWHYGNDYLYRWVRKADTIWFQYSNELPGSGGGTYVSQSRKMVRLK